MSYATVNFLKSDKKELTRGGVWSAVFRFSSDMTNKTIKAQCRDNDGNLLIDFTIVKDSVDNRRVTMSVDEATLLLCFDGRFDWDLKVDDLYRFKGELDIVTGTTQDD